MRDHTSLLAWQEAKAVSLAVIELARTYWKPYAWALFQQLQRSSLSTQLNIAEGYTFGASPSLRRHLRIAYGSAVETGELLDLLFEVGLGPASVIKRVRERNRRSQRLLMGILKAGPEPWPRETPAAALR